MQKNQQKGKTDYDRSLEEKIGTKKKDTFNGEVLILTSKGWKVFCRIYQADSFVYKAF